MAATPKPARHQRPERGGRPSPRLLAIAATFHRPPAEPAPLRMKDMPPDPTFRAPGQRRAAR